MWLESAEALEAQALPRANVYPIREHGQPHGYRPADLEALEAARFLKTFAAERLRITAHA
jgi:hypothetical protein